MESLYKVCQYIAIVYILTITTWMGLRNSTITFNEWKVACASWKTRTGRLKMKMAVLWMMMRPLRLPPSTRLIIHATTQSRRNIPTSVAAVLDKI
jgi:hypothetical protein